MKHITVKILFFIIFFPAIVLSGEYEYHRNLKWNGITTYNLSGEDTVKVLSFEGAQHNISDGFQPRFFERFPIENAGDIKLSLMECIYETVPASIADKLSSMENTGKEITLDFHLSYANKRPYVTLSFIPVRKNEMTGFYEKLVSFKVNITVDEYLPDKQGGGNPYVAHSVLATGNWVKLQVSEDGIYKIGYSQLSDYGINPASINPKNIRIYGLPGGMLPEDPTAFRYDDLQELAIYVKGENDGSFGTDDYILFYGQGAHEWYYNESDMSYMRKMNIYADHNYYFLTVDLGEGKRVQQQEWPQENPTVTVDNYTFAIHHEVDKVNLISTGREWYGETFDLYLVQEDNYSIPAYEPNALALFKARVVARSQIVSSFKFFANDNQILSLNVTQVEDMSSQTRDYAKISMNSAFFTMTSANVKIKTTYNKPYSSSIGWLDYYVLNVVCNLKFQGGQLPFRNLTYTGEDAVAEYVLTNSSSNVTIWNVSDPLTVTKMKTGLSGDKMKFRIRTNELHEFVAWDGSSFKSPAYAGTVANQDLHGIADYDFVIITAPEFEEQADRLADFHREHDGMSVFVVTPQLIYNEFSAGKQDISAIRDFLMMLYNRSKSENYPKYVLFFGDASYDYKNRISGNTNFVPTWESGNSINYVSSIASDDFFALLDIVEKDDMLDIAIGRFVVTNTAQAKNAVDKVINYSNNNDNTMGDWRNVICMVADDEDNNTHLSQAENLASLIDTLAPAINIDKIYFDAYNQVSTPGGQKYPDVNRDINARVERGALMINYTGHGGELGWAHERVLENKDILGWKNWNKLAVFITATCEFSRYDDPERVSAGENVLLNPNGGAIALFTTSRPTYASSNFTLNKGFYKYALNKFNGEYLTMGKIMQMAKNETNNDKSEGQKFIFLGDPALKIAFPADNYAVTTEINNNVVVNGSTDTLRALSYVTIKGEMQDINGNKLSDFNGTLYPTVFDKPYPYTTLANDPTSITSTFYIQKNPIYKGKVSIINGEWQFSFIVPKDIAYQYGLGKISYYAKNENSDGSGYFFDIVVGGYNEDAGVDTKKPDIKLYMNDENFIFGGLTDENPFLFAKIFDLSGINTVGSGVGHDIIAVLDNSKTIILNDYYETELNDYKYGRINYPFFNLNEGLHTLSLKVWDVYNNSAEAYTEFVVAESPEMALDYVMNIPNPFVNSTTFLFEHNQSEEPISIKIEIYSLSGQLVKTITDMYNSGGYVYKSERWDGCDESGVKLKRGIYFYRVLVTNYDGKVSSANNKLVIIK